MIDKLTEKDIGRFVIYNPGYKTERGIIKSFNKDFAFVVFHCNYEWNRYQEYTGAATKLEHLTFEEV